jgi:hypothetical protein
MPRGLESRDRAEVGAAWTRPSLRAVLPRREHIIGYRVVALWQFMQRVSNAAAAPMYRAD